MKTFLATLLLATLCAATGYGQTIKSLGYNTTNGTVVYSGTNTLKFENNVVFDQDVSGTYFETVSGGGSNGVQMTATGMLFLGTAAATTRTNLGLGATWLTNTNTANFRTAIGLGTNDQPVFDGATITGDLFAGGVEVAGGLNSINVASDGLQFTGISAATTRTNLGLGNGITANRTFVSYNGTNYTTNSVTISNGIITGWEP
jgi:hypothetical protein